VQASNLAHAFQLQFCWTLRSHRGCHEEPFSLFWYNGGLHEVISRKIEHFQLEVFFNAIQLPYLPIYDCTALVELGQFFSFLIYTKTGGLLGRGISPSHGRYLHKEQHKHRINARRHPCIEWDSNPVSQCLKQANTVHAADRAATVIGSQLPYYPQNIADTALQTNQSPSLDNYWLPCEWIY
jgi:hypothetical protein